MQAIFDNLSLPILPPSGSAQVQEETAHSCRIHQTSRETPAMEAGFSGHVSEIKLSHYRFAHEETISCSDSPDQLTVSEHKLESPSNSENSQTAASLRFSASDGLFGL
jgi:hypothetical protein